MKMCFPLLNHPQGGFGNVRHQANNSQKIFCYGPRCSKESWEKVIARNLKLMSHREKINVITGAGDAIYTN